LIGAFQEPGEPRPLRNYVWEMVWADILQREPAELREWLDGE